MDAPVSSIDTCDGLIVYFGHVYGLSDDAVWQMYHTMRRESGFDPTAINEKDSEKGSAGCSQINLSAHTTVTKEQALNMYFATNFMAREFSLGHQRMWTCWREWYGGEPKKYCPQK